MRKTLLYLSLLLGLLYPLSSETRVLPYEESVIFQKEATVYITRTGAKYHRDGCRYLSKSKIKTIKKEAVKNGYEACKVCRP
ncbi:hypothetical protein [Olivibacter sitiensis]|uniref:hypothetical protein n=1 Tax=Olivibacter sitiensis TaxID=376470 RepID=UPI000410EABD|nr:hypothetical protein [Olivibacter sitiensis]